MTIQLPSAYGVILRKSDRTAAVIERHVQSMRATASRHADAGPLVLNEDAQLYGMRVANSGQDALYSVREFEAMNLVQGREFVLTRDGAGLLEKRPAWLQQNIHDSGGRPVGSLAQLLNRWELRRRDFVWTYDALD